MKRINPNRLRQALDSRKQRWLIDQLRNSTKYGGKYKMHPSGVSRWINGERPVPRKFEPVLAHLLNRTLTWLKGGDDNPFGGNR